MILHDQDLLSTALASVWPREPILHGLCCWSLRATFGVIPMIPPRLADAVLHCANFGALWERYPSPVPPVLHIQYGTLTSCRSADTLQLQLDILNGSVVDGRGHACSGSAFKSISMKAHACHLLTTPGVLNGESSKRLATPRNTKNKKHDSG